MDTQMATTEDNSSLLSVPLEVLLNITYHLTTPEYGDLRLTCKHIESTLLTAFSREFFTKRQFMFTEFSLQTLIDISKSRFSSTLSHVIFGLERPTMRTVPSIIHFSANPPPVVPVKQDRLLEEYVSHMTLLNTGQDVEMLAEAFSNLGNLDTIGMRDFNSRSRRRDYPNVEWKSYGVRTFELATSNRLEVARRMHAPFGGFNISDSTFLDQANYLSRVFLNILRGLGKASSRPNHYEVILRHTSLHDHAFNLPNYVEPLVSPVLTNLNTLFLDLNWQLPPAQVNVNGVQTACPSYLLRKFLSKLSNLEHLRLNFEFHPGQETNDVLSWLSRPASTTTPNTTSTSSLPESPQPIDFANLRQLDIGMVTVEPKFLLAIIRKYRATLRSISCHKVSLLQADSAPAGARVNLWAQLFGQLSKLNLNLSNIYMSLLSQEQTGKQHVRTVTFKDTRDPKKKNWAGTDTQSGLRDYTDLVVVEGLDHDTSSESDGSDVEGSDDFMDDVDGDDDADEEDDV